MVERNGVDVLLSAVMMDSESAPQSEGVQLVGMSEDGKEVLVLVLAVLFHGSAGENAIEGDSLVADKEVREVHPPAHAPDSSLVTVEFSHEASCLHVPNFNRSFQIT